jgi:hypothetical protein
MIVYGSSLILALTLSILLDSFIGIQFQEGHVLIKMFGSSSWFYTEDALLGFCSFSSIIIPFQKQGILIASSVVL